MLSSSLTKLITNLMAKSSLNPIQFIEDALFCTTPLALTYSDPDQKWIIRQHLISLFQDFPSLKPSVNFFTHNDGTEVKILKISGELGVSSHNAPTVPVIIWVHEFYPQMAPIVYVNVEESVYPIYENHPFVDSSGSTNSYYLMNWKFLESNLLGLVRNLIKIFSLNHPFYYNSDSTKLITTHPSIVSKTEAMDRLTCAIHYDLIAIAAENEEEIGRLSIVQAELGKRAEIVNFLVRGLESEIEQLEERVNEISDDSDELMNWLKQINEKRYGIDDDGFEPLDEKSEILIELTAIDNAIEDLMYALDEAVEEGVVDFQIYVKQVRVLAREQFFNRAKIIKVEKMGF